MTETNPGRPDREPPEAGTTGARRKEVSEPVAPEERGSLNIPPNQPEGTPTEDLGVSASERDGTPRPVENSITEKTTGSTRAGDVNTESGGQRDTERTNKESLRRDIEDARRELGDTVEALVHKTDVKSRVQETTAQVGSDLRKVGAATAGTATEMVGRVKEAAPQVVGRVKEAGPKMVGRVKEATPVEIKDAAEKVTTQAGKRPVATIAAVAALALIAFRFLRRGKKK